MIKIEPTSNWCGACYRKKNVSAISISRNDNHWATTNLCIKCRKELRSLLKPSKVEI